MRIRIDQIRWDIWAPLFYKAHFLSNSTGVMFEIIIEPGLIIKYNVAPDARHIVMLASGKLSRVIIKLKIS